MTLGSKVVPIIEEAPAGLGLRNRITPKEAVATAIPTHPSVDLEEPC